MKFRRDFNNFWIYFTKICIFHHENKLTKQTIFTIWTWRIFFQTQPWTNLSFPALRNFHQTTTNVPNADKAKTTATLASKSVAPLVSVKICSVSMLSLSYTSSIMLNSFTTMSGSWLSAFKTAFFKWYWEFLVNGPIVFMIWVLSRGRLLRFLVESLQTWKGFSI